MYTQSSKHVNRLNSYTDVFSQSVEPVSFEIVCCTGNNNAFSFVNIHFIHSDGCVKYRNFTLKVIQSTNINPTFQVKSTLFT